MNAPRAGGRLAVVVCALSLALTACAGLPDSGEISTRPAEEQVQQGDAPFDFNPPGPLQGASPLDIIEDFLLAMQASPQSTAVAREYLSAEARSSWKPETATLVYGARILTGERRVFQIRFEDAVRLDGRGSWMGEAGPGGTVEHRFQLVREDGEWRIANPPDTLLIPQSHFESRYQQYFVYFYEPTAQILVPEPVYLPRGEQAPTLLLRRLLRGPDPGLGGVLRTFIPGGTRYVLSVTVSADGVADIPLSAEFLELGKDELQLALAQIGWTLRQLPGLDSMRVTVDGSPLDIPGEGSPQSVNAWTQFDPSIHWASQELFGIRENRVVALSTDGRSDAAGQFGAQEYLLRDIAVDLAAERVAAVTQDGRTVVLAPRARAGGEAPPASSTQVVYTGGTDVLAPAWDFLGELWLVDRRFRGAALSVVREGEVSRVPAPGLAGQAVKAFVVSRDGTRLVAAVTSGGRDRLVVARVLRDDAGRVRGLTRPATLPMGLPEGQEPVEIRDLVWRTPGALAVLTGPARASSQVVTVLVDGSSTTNEDGSPPEVLDVRADRLVGSPSPGMPTFVAARSGRLYELTADGQWVEASVKGALGSPVFVG